MQLPQVGKNKVDREINRVKLVESLNKAEERVRQACQTFHMAIREVNERCLPPEYKFIRRALGELGFAITMLLPATWAKMAAEEAEDTAERLKDQAAQARSSLARRIVPGGKPRRSATPCTGCCFGQRV